MRRRRKPELPTMTVAAFARKVLRACGQSRPFVIFRYDYDGAWAAATHAQRQWIAERLFGMKSIEAKICELVCQGFSLVRRRSDGSIIEEVDMKRFMVSEVRLRRAIVRKWKQWQRRQAR